LFRPVDGEPSAICCARKLLQIAYLFAHGFDLLLH
jgi:hypothetical protein